MKALLLVLATFLGVAAFVSEANAAVCARGVYRAGCAGPRGAVVARRPYGYYGRARVYRRY